jgi:hypothetical protein
LISHFPWNFKSWVGKLLKIWVSNPRSGRSKRFCSFFSIFKFFTQKCASFILFYVVKSSFFRRYYVAGQIAKICKHFTAPEHFSVHRWTLKCFQK